MSHGWSAEDKGIAKAAAERARRRAEQEAIALHATYKINHWYNATFRAVVDRVIAEGKKPSAYDRYIEHSRDVK